MNLLIMDDNQEFAYQLKNDLSAKFCTLTDETNYDVITNNFSKTPLKKHYDFAFLDIDLINENGIKLAKTIEKSLICNKIVFISSHSHLIHDSLIVHPYFFIRKDNYEDDLRILFDLIDESFVKHIFIVTKFLGEKKAIQLEKIIYAAIQDKILCIYTTESSYNDNRQLKKFMEEISSNNFVQISKSTIINMDYLYSFNANEIIMVNNISLKLGRSYKKEFMKKYQEYLIL